MTGLSRLEEGAALGFQSPQKPKGDCDSVYASAKIAGNVLFQSPQKPKGDCDLGEFLRRDPELSLVPITPKAERRL